MAKNKSDAAAPGANLRYPAITRSISFAGTHADNFLRRPASSNANTVGSSTPINAVVSVLVVPIIIGTVAEFAGPSGTQGAFGRNLPSTTGLKFGFGPGD